MQAITLTDHGDVDVLQLTEVDDPQPGPEEVLVKVRATALNRADLLQRRGLYPGPPAAVEIPGLEFAGTVVAAGERVRQWSEGDEVMGIVGGGAYAELVCTHERTLMAVPKPVGLADAAAVPEVFLTAYDALVVQGGMTSGSWALVHAGASGVGTAAIQLAKAFGARIIVTCSTAKVQACRTLGADVVVDYTVDDFVSQASDATGGLGVDVVLDVIGGDYLVRNLKSIRTGGRIIQVGVMDPTPVQLPLGMILPKRAQLIGTVLRSRPLEEKIALTQRAIREVLPRFADGSLVPVIDSRFPLSEMAAAHSLMESNANIGKILIDVAG